MKDEAFNDLVNLHLDGELTDAQNAELAQLIADDPRRLKSFQNACRLHNAAQMALDPEILQPKDFSKSYLKLRCLIGMAAVSCALLGIAFLLPCLLHDESDHECPPFLSEDLNKVLKTNGTELIAKSEDPERLQDGMSLAAYLRLQGLNPDSDKRLASLKSIDPKALQTDEAIQIEELKLVNHRVAELNLNKIQRQSKIFPSSKALQLPLPTNRMNKPSKSAFKSALVDYQK